MLKEGQRKELQKKSQKADYKLCDVITVMEYLSSMPGCSSKPTNKKVHFPWGIMAIDDL